MSVDFQVCFPQETVNVTGIRAIPGDLNLIEVQGDDFSAIDTILVNDVEVKDYAVLSRTFLRAQLPLGMRPADVTTVSILSRRLVITARSSLKFRIGRVPSKTSGILRLMQLYAKTLLTDPTSDSFNPNYGGGLLRHIGGTFSSGSAGGSMLNDAAVAVRLTNEQIIAVQSRQPQLPADERLLTASIVHSAFSPNEAALKLEIDLRNQTGQPALINLVY
jgi:hypothetical protein